MQLINTGLGRTGTTSLQAALARLGFGPSFHMFELVHDEQCARQWEQVACDGGRADWDALFAGYRSAVDGPCALYYRELRHAFPEAKLMLTLRDAQSWYRSTYDTLFQFVLRSRSAPPPPGSQPERVLRITTALIWDGLFDGRFEDKDHAIAVYERHNAEVIEFAGDDDLLVWKVSQGWQPLCEYLGLDVPDDVFPHVNDAATMRARIAAMSS